MTDATFSSVSGALEQRIRARLARQPNRSTVLLNLLPKRDGSGKNVAFDVSVGTDAGQIFDAGADVSTYNNDTEVLATLPWCTYGDAFAVEGLAMDAAAGEPTELARLALKKLVDAGQRAAAKINVDLYTGAGTASPQKIVGFTITAGPMDATGQYAGVDRGTYPQFASNLDDTAGPLTLSRIEQMFESIYTASGMSPKYLMTTPALWRRYAELVAPEKRYMQEVFIRGETIRLDGGWRALDVNGIPMFKDKDCPSGMMLFINDDHCGVEVLPKAPDYISDNDFLGQFPIAGTPQEQAGAVPDSPGLMARLYKLARAGDKRKFQLFCRPQLWCDKPNTQGLIKNIT